MVLIGGPLADAGATTGHATSPTGTMRPASITCDNTPPDCDPDVCFCPVW